MSPIFSCESKDKVALDKCFQYRSRSTLLIMPAVTQENNIMKEITIREVSTRADMERFVRFGNEMYRKCTNAVPDLLSDLKNTFDAHKNAAYEFCQTALFLALEGKKVVGRVAGIINERANATWNVSNVRFSYLDFVDDARVSAALIHTVEDWGREKGMTHCQGPMGFTDFDKEGMLIEGFEYLSSITTYYNFPYYPKHLEALGYTKEVDWIQLRMAVPEQIPERFQRVGQLVKSRYNLRVVKLDKEKMFSGGYGRRIFNLFNEAYSPLFGYSALSEKQIDNFVASYFNIIDMRLVPVIEDTEGNIVGIGVTMGSLSKAMKKAGGSLFPFGWLHILKSLKIKMEDTVEMLLIAVKPEYQGKGVNALLFCDLIPIYNSLGFKWAETGPQLESNHKELNQWGALNPHISKRRRCFTKAL